MPTPYAADMDQERDGYADNDLPPPRRWLRDVLLVMTGVMVIVSLWILVLIWSVANGPQFDD
jgi:hypothetical protein